MTAALQALLEWVDAGEFPADTSARDLGIASDGLPIIKTMYSAFSGSLDAARALHDAVLPGWVKWNMQHSYFGYECDLTNGDCDTSGVSKDNPARAWLIAILRALIAASVAENEGGV